MLLFTCPDLLRPGDQPLDPFEDPFEDPLGDQRGDQLGDQLLPFMENSSHCR
jgi:hypothetical protein